MHVKQYLEKHKLTQEKFAQMLGYSQGAVFEIANFFRAPNRASAMRICELTAGEVTPEELLFPERHGHQQINDKRKTMREAKKKEKQGE